MQLIVLGMHRSGTSVLARLLNMMGVYFGPEGASTGANKENPKGFWERRDVRQLNDFVLHSAGCDWNRIADFKINKLPDSVVAEFRSRASSIVLEMDAHRPWMLKEPRLCLLLELWQQQLEVPVCILIYRNPLEVAQSLRVRNDIPLHIGIALWEKYNLSALSASRKFPRFAVSHQGLMCTPEIEVNHIYEQLLRFGVDGLRLPSKREITSFIRSDLYRERIGEVKLAQHLNAKQLQIFKAFSDGSILNNKRNTRLSAAAVEILKEYEQNLGFAQSTELAQEQAERREAELQNQQVQIEKELREQIEQKIEEAKNQYVKAEQLESELKKHHAQQEHALTQQIKQQAQKAKEEREKATTLETELRDQREQEEKELRRQIEEHIRDAKKAREKAQQIETDLKNQHSQQEHALTQQIKQQAQEAKETRELTSRVKAELENQHRHDEQALSRQIKQQAQEAKETRELASRVKAELENQHRHDEQALRRQIEQQAQELKAALAAADKQLSSLKKQHADQKNSLCQEIEKQVQEVKNTRKKTKKVTAKFEVQHAQDKKNLSEIRKAIAAFKKELSKVKLQKLEIEKQLESRSIELRDSGQTIDSLKDEVASGVQATDDAVKYVEKCLQDIRQLERWLHIVEFHLGSWRWRGGRAAIGSFAKLLGKWDGGIDTDDINKVLANFKNWEYSRDKTGAGGLAVISNDEKESTPPDRHALLLQSSGLFDADWYLKEYPDVKANGVDPIQHYLKFGSKEHRNPGPDFDTRWYLKNYPDVAKSDINPLEHYILYGREEFRAPKPFLRLNAPSDFGEEIAIVVTVFNALPEVKKCLKSINDRRDGFIVDVIVVNDGSDMQTTSWLNSYCDSHDSFRLIEHGRNEGYTHAVNSGLNMATASYVVVINSDTIVTQGWLKGLIGCFNSDPQIGIAGPLSSAASWQNVPNLYDTSGDFAVNQLHKGTTPDEMAQIVATASSRCYPKLPFVNGFCLMIRREVIDAIGLMDEEMFPAGYGEENDYCIRASDAGYKLAIADDAYVFHSKSKSFGHARSIQLANKGVEALRRKHTSVKFDALVKRAKNTKIMDRVRASIRDAMNVRDSKVEAVNIDLLKILFLLPAQGGGGGAHSVVQEVSEMQRLGVHAKIAVKESQRKALLETYRDIANVDDLFVDFTTENLRLIGKDYDVVVGTIFHSMSLVKQIVDDNPQILPAYYIQDYEPLFFQPESENWRAARESYSLIPDTLLFAKTYWIANMVEKNHAVVVHKVCPSIDHSLYAPELKKKRDEVVIAAMIRPQTPWRGSERTMRLLSRLAGKSVRKVRFCLFGCSENDPGFQNLERNFDFQNSGLLTRPEVAALLAGCDIFIDLSDYQAFGRTALEAMACGCAVMVPEHGGTDEYAIDEVNALVVDSFDEESSFLRLDDLISDDRKLRAMQKESLLTAASYTVYKAALSELTLFQRALPEHRSRRIDDGSKDLGSIDSRKRTSAALGRIEIPLRKLPITALVITWDVGHNPVGRSYMLAEVLDRVVRNVVLIGFQFPRYGDDTWEPLRNSKIPIISLPGTNFPDFLNSLERIAQRIDPDAVFSCKSRLPSTQLGAMIKDRIGCPLFIDIDDHELTFFKNASEISIESLGEKAFGSAKTDVEPFEGLWTGIAQNTRRFADQVLVSNEALQSKFGGAIVPHVRDEHYFDPKLFDRDLIRKEFGIPENARVVLFFGTPRPHKGINLIADSVAKLDDDRALLVVVGNAPDRRDAAKLQDLAGNRVVFLPNQPFERIPSIVSMADVICLPQDPAHATSHFQLPAKAIDAIAMGIPLLVTATEPFKRLIELGVAVEISPETIVSELGKALQPQISNHHRNPNDRQVFLQHFSYAAAAKTLRGLIVNKLKNNSLAPAFHAEFSSFIQAQKHVLGIPEIKQTSSRKPGRDFVLFWKQNDTTLYGRRVDMFIKYLASREDVRKVIVFDAPISESELLRMRKSANSTSQDRWIYIKTYEKILGKLDTEKVSYNVFAHAPGLYSLPGRETADTDPLATGYLPFISKVLKREEVIPQDAIFWFYPKNFLATQIIDCFKPARIAIDVIDDHRAWPGVRDIEKTRLTENYQDMLSRADMVMVNCEPMLDKMKILFADTRLVPNGCDSSPPATRPMHSKEFEELAAWEGKTIGFVGNLEAKIDIELIKKIALRFTDCRIILLGSTHTNSKILELKKVPNIRMPGVVPYAQIGAWIRLFDVGIIPHRVTDMTRNMNPLKVLVYLQWGLPIVITNVENIGYNGPLLKTTTTHKMFLLGIDGFLQSTIRDKKKNQEFIHRNDWKARFKKHIDELLVNQN